MLTTVLATCSWVTRGLLAALLPAPERDRVQVGLVSAARWSAFVGYVEGILGILLYVLGVLTYLGLVGGNIVDVLVESRASLLEAHFRAGGLVSWISWHLQPEAWLYIYLAVTGSVRVVAYFIAQQPVAEPVVLLAVRAVQAIARRGDRMRVRLLFGPLCDDRAVVEEGCDLVLLSCRKKDDWDEHTIVKVGDRFYGVLDIAVRSVVRPWVLAYRLEELDENDAIRSFVRSPARPPAQLPDKVTRPSLGGLFYFAFGRLMDADEMWGVAPSARMISVARCPRHRLSLHRPGGDGTGCLAAVASISPSDSVWGIVWDCALADVEALNAAERIGHECRWENLEVKGTDGKTYLARVCVSDLADLDLSLAPSPACLESILTAARAHDLPRAYLAPLLGTRS